MEGGYSAASSSKVIMVTADFPSMAKTVIRDQGVAHRVQHLGRIGESLAKKSLAEAGFTEIINLNEVEMNFPFGDILAQRDGQKYVISVKARNKFQNNGKLNSRYKLGQKCYEHAANAASRFSAVPAFLAIALEDETYSAFFGALTLLDGKRGVPMYPKDTARYECITKDEKHLQNTEQFKNRYKHI